MKFIITFLLLAATIVGRAANPAYQDFNANQFGVNGNKVRLKSGVIVTNPVIGAGTLTGQITTGAVTNENGSRAAYLEDIGTVGATNIYFTNIFATNIYTSNFFTTNLFATNAYITNLVSTVNVTSNLFATNIITTNLYSSNIYTTNLFVTGIVRQHHLRIKRIHNKPVRVRN